MVNNEFRFIGVVVGESKVTTLGNGAYVINFVMKISNLKTYTYVPIATYGKTAIVASQVCSNGNLISVSGKVMSKDYFNTELGSSQIRIMFIAKEIMLLSKVKRKTIAEKSYSELIGLYSLDDYISK